MWSKCVNWPMISSDVGASCRPRWMFGSSTAAEWMSTFQVRPCNMHLVWNILQRAGWFDVYSGSGWYEPLPEQWLSSLRSVFQYLEKNAQLAVSDKLTTASFHVHLIPKCPVLQLIDVLHVLRQWWYSTVFVRVPPDVISVQLSTPKDVAV
jgi:hypothetical protein